MGNPRLRIDDAINHYNNRVMAKNILKNVKQTEGMMIKASLAEKLWSKSKHETRVVNMSNLISGKTKTISIEMVEIICNECEVDPNFLFNINSKL